MLLCQMSFTALQSETMLLGQLFICGLHAHALSSCIEVVFTIMHLSPACDDRVVVFGSKGQESLDAT